MYANGQTVRYEFINLDRIDVQRAIQSKSDQLRFRLSRQGITDSDTIDIYFSKWKEFIVVTCDSAIAKKVYQQFVLHLSAIRPIVKYRRLEYFRVLVMAGRDRYYKTNYSTLSPLNEASRLKDEKLYRHFRKFGIDYPIN